MASRNPLEMTKLPVSDTPFDAVSNGPVVVLSDPGGVCRVVTPEAVLDSLLPMKEAAERAIRNRAKGRSSF